MQFGIPNEWGISALNFQTGKMAKALLKITDLLTFLVNFVINQARTNEGSRINNNNQSGKC